MEGLYSVVKNNADDIYERSLDFSTLCKKRVIMGATTFALQQKLGRGLLPEEISKVREALDLKGIVVSCGACYVESTRIKLGLAIERWTAYNPEYAEFHNNLLTQTGLDKLKRDNPKYIRALRSTSLLRPSR
jgi:hypothetical protein